MRLNANPSPNNLEFHEVNIQDQVHNHGTYIINKDKKGTDGVKNIFLSKKRSRFRPIERKSFVLFPFSVFSYWDGEPTKNPMRGTLIYQEKTKNKESNKPI